MTNLSKVLITGAGGFLGSYIVRDLFEKGGYEIYTFSRKKYSHLDKYGVIQIQGDLQNALDVLNATKGMDAIIHTASQVGMWGEYELFFNTNFLGTKNIIEACKQNQIKKLVYTSTPSVAFGNTDLLGVDESTPYPKKYYSFYAETKALAEKLVLKSNGHKLSTVAIRPHLIFGPGDQNLIPRVLESAKKNKLKIVGDGENQVDVSYVENVSHIHLLALEKLSAQSPIAGKAYFFGQGPVKLWDFINDILEKKNINKVTKKISLKKAYALGFLIEKIFQIFKIKKIEPPMTRFVAMQLGMSHYYDHHALKRDFGEDYLKFSLDEGIKKLLANQ